MKLISRITVFLVFSALTSLVRAEPVASDPKEMTFASWPIPTSVVSQADRSSTTGERIPLLGFKKREGSTQFDATDFLAAIGVTFPPESEAVYSMENGELIVRNSRENLEKIDRVLSRSGLSYLPANLTVELSIYECKLPVPVHPTEARLPTIANLESLPKEDVKSLDRVSCAAKSGQRVQLNQIRKSASARLKVNKEQELEDEPSMLFAPGESGVKADWEVTIGPDGIITDSTVEFRWRGEPVDGHAAEIACNTSFTSREGSPIVLNATPVPNKPGSYLVAVGLVRIFSAREWTLEELKAEAAKIEARKE